MGKKPYSFVVAFFVVVFLVVSSQFAAANTPEGDCSYLIAGRTYAHQFGAFINTDMFPLPMLTGTLPNAGMGTVIFNEDGTVGGTTALKIGPAFLPDVPMVNATYSVKWDSSKKPSICTGTMKSEVPQSPTGWENWQIIVADKGNRIELMHTDMGLTVGVTAFPAHQARCSNRTLNGAYSYNAKGWTMPMPQNPPPPATELFNGFMPMTFSGAIEFIPSENGSKAGIPNTPANSSYFRGWDTVSINGVIVQRKFVGWYQVDATCNSTMTMLDDIGNPPINTKVQILKGANRINVLNTDVPFVLSFSADRISSADSD